MTVKPAPSRLGADECWMNAAEANTAEKRRRPITKANGAKTRKNRTWGANNGKRQ